MNQQKTDSLGWTNRVRVEKRSDQFHVRAPLPFTATIAGKEYRGFEVSLGDFAVDRPVEGPANKAMGVMLAFPFKGFRISIPLKAKIQRVDTANNRTELKIASIGDEEHRLLRDIISSFLSGTLLSYDDLMSQADAPTPTGTQSGIFAPEETGHRRMFGKLVRYSTVASFAGVLVIAALVAAYDRFYVLEAPFAATTAPRIDVLASGAGMFQDNGVLVGDTVSRDTTIGLIENAALSGELALARATLTYQEKLEQRLIQAMDNKDMDAIDALTASLGGSSSDGDNVMLLLSAQSRIEELQSLNEMQRSRIDALQYTAGSGIIYSPCDCRVHWARGGSNSWVQEGDKLYELILNEANGLMVEAQVPMDYVRRLDRHQEAQVTFLDGKTYTGTAVEINLEGSHRPRAGFPEWIRHDMSKATVLIELNEQPEGVGVGEPVDVSFSTALPQMDPMIDRAEKVVSSGLSQLRLAVASIFGATIPVEPNAASNEIAQPDPTTTQPAELALPQPE